MKQAMLDGVEVHAGPDAPAQAVCPTCGGKVTLTHQPRGGWYYRHRRGVSLACSRRPRPREELPEPEPTYVQGDPYVFLAQAALRQAIRQARKGDPQAILSIGFSPVIQALLDVLGRCQEELLAVVTPPPPEGPPEVLVTDDEAEVLARVREAPSPVFDIRSSHNGHLRELVALPWYVRLPRVGPADLRVLLWVLAYSRQVYVLGQPDAWTQVLEQARRLGQDDLFPLPPAAAPR